MKRICFFSGDITRCGGTEKVSAYIAGKLAQTGKYRIVFLSLTEQNLTPFFPVSPDIKRYTLRNDGKWILPGPGYLPMIPALRRFLKRKRIDIIIDIDLVLDVLSVPAAAGLPVRIISWEHFNCCYEQKILYRRIIAGLSVHFSDHIVTLTRQDKQDYQKRLHRRGRIDYIYNPVEIPVPEDTGTAGPCFSGPKERMLVTIGHLNKRKGTDLLLQIIPCILRRHRNWRWYFLGDGEYREQLEQTRLSFHLEGQLILAGSVPNVGDYLSRASLCVMASRAEGLPVCLLEAKVYRVPSVCFDIRTGPSEIIENGINGYLIPPFDLKQMARKIVYLIENDDLRNQFSKNTAIGMEKFQPEPILQKWERLLDLYDNTGGNKEHEQADRQCDHPRV